MNASLALYAALQQASVPSEAAKKVADALEHQLTTDLASKDDVAALRELVNVQHNALRELLVSQSGGLTGRVMAELATLRAQVETSETRLLAAYQNVLFRAVTMVSAVILATLGLAGAVVKFLQVLS